MPDAPPVLDCRDIVVRFGGLVAVNHVSMTAVAGEITGLIGPNGAGKTTMFNAITGVITPNSGIVLMDGTEITGWPPHRRGRAGMARTFQRLELFTGLTVYDNLLAAWEASKPGAVVGRGRGAGPAEVGAVIDQLGLATLAKRAAGELSTGQGRMVELARALCVGARILLLDEPSSGLDSAETDRFKEVLLDVVEDSAGALAVVIVEHDMGLVMEVCDAITVLDFGSVICAGDPDHVRRDPAVKAAYLGDTAA
jgi:branched-chain amino acid transport system ATP-binding protein